jgi:hypothetical protein
MADNENLLTCYRREADNLSNPNGLITKFASPDSII